ncbi:glycosyltransferase family 4 protein [Robbsia andropogonis]|uniref:glycosyltransferase family 4 protein n=1 Tax=Robbsia andropogonis TaxID=28092 RepID=UPI002A6A229E|nr:glycosyltransferase family 4 protein [Robbsia andropogonis]
MKILMSIHHTLDKHAGAAGVTWKLAEAFREQGHEVDLFTFDSLGKHASRFGAILFPWHVLFHVMRHPEYEVLDLSSGDGWIVNMLKRFGWRKHTVSVTRSHGLEHVVHEQFVENCKKGEQKKSWKYPIYHGGYRLWEVAMSFRHADAGLFLNQADREYAVTKLGVRRDRAILVENGVDTVFVQRAAATLTALQTKAAVTSTAMHVDSAASSTDPAMKDVAPRHIAFIGSNIFRKGITYFKAATLQVMQRYPDIRIAFIGTGDKTGIDGILKDYPAALHARIAVIPRYQNHALPELLDGYGILGLTSISEGFSLVGVEAMASGLVPVCSRIPGPTEYISDERNGLLVEARNAAQLVAAFTRLIEDDALWQRLHLAALQTCERFSWQRIAVQQLSLFASLAKGLGR